MQLRCGGCVRVESDLSSALTAYSVTSVGLDQDAIVTSKFQTNIEQISRGSRSRPLHLCLGPLVTGQSPRCCQLDKPTSCQCIHSLVNQVRAKSTSHRICRLPNPNTVTTKPAHQRINMVSTVHAGTIDGGPPRPHTTIGRTSSSSPLGKGHQPQQIVSKLERTCGGPGKGVQPLSFTTLGRYHVVSPNSASESFASHTATATVTSRFGLNSIISNQDSHPRPWLLQSLVQTDKC